MDGKVKTTILRTKWWDLSQPQQEARLDEIKKNHGDWANKKPDWKNPKNYPPDDASPDCWAWEFLKRNKKYKDECLALFWEIKLSVEEEESKTEQEIQDSREILAGERKKHADKWSIGSYDFDPATVAGIAPNTRPNTDNFYSPFRFKTSGPDLISYDQQSSENGPRRAVVEEKPDTALIRFDLTKPIGPQIKAATLYLAANYRGTTKKISHSAENFREYLRAFDGYSELEGSNHTKVEKDKLLIKTFSEENNEKYGADYEFEQNVKNWFARAEYFIAGGYIEIPLQMNAQYWKERKKEQNQKAKV